MSDSDFNPDWASPPGDTIYYILCERKITITVFARKIGLTIYEVQLLIEGIKIIDDELAGKLSGVLGSTKKFWLKREQQYREQLIKLGKSK